MTSFGHGMYGSGQELRDRDSTVIQIPRDDDQRLGNGPSMNTGETGETGD